MINWFVFVICSEEYIYKLVLIEFIFEIRLKSVKKDVCGFILEDIVIIVRNCFCLNINSKVDIVEFRLFKLFFDVFVDLFGWKFKVFILAKVR